MPDPASFLQGRSRETTIARDDQGRWFQDGQALEHPNLTRAFDRWLVRAEDGRYCLKNDINWAYVTLEGPPYFVRSVQMAPSGISVLLSNDAREPLRAESLRSGEDGALYCDVGDGSLVARFDSNAALQLETLIGEDEQGVYLDIAGQRVRPKSVRNPLEPVTAQATASAARARDEH